MISPRQRIAFVTGASKGLGFALAAKLSSAGYFVVLNARGKKDLEIARQKLEFPQFAAVFAADVSGAVFASALKKFMARQKLLAVDVVVHSAAVNHMGTIAEARAVNVVRAFGINTLSFVALAQTLRSYLEKGVNPHFVLVSSLMQYFAMPGRGVYAASKSAAESLVGAWREELCAEKSPIRVQIFRPAGIDTDFHSNTKTDGDAPRSGISRMSATAAAEHLFALLESNAREGAPGVMNTLVAFFARHFPGLIRLFVQRRYRKNL